MDQGNIFQTVFVGAKCFNGLSLIQNTALSRLHKRIDQLHRCAFSAAAGAHKHIKFTFFKMTADGFDGI